MYKIEIYYRKGEDDIVKLIVYNQDIAVEIAISDWDRYLVSEVCERVVSAYEKLGE